jgi:hypothetical protein
MKDEISKCERCIAAKCKGKLVEAKKKYGKYAYWCGIEQDGWKSKPCKHFKC